MRIPAAPAPAPAHDERLEQLLHLAARPEEGGALGREQPLVGVAHDPRGTAYGRLHEAGIRVAGKTGTAQVFTVAQDAEYDEETLEKKLRDHALFIAYAPIEDPQIAVAVVVENGGHGGSVAAPIARQIMDAYLLPDEAKAEADNET